MGKNRLVNLNFRSECGTRPCSRPCGALSFRKLKLRPWRLAGGPTTTRPRGPLMRETPTLRSSGRWEFVFSTYLFMTEMERSRMESMGEGFPSLLERASARMEGGRVVTGKAIWERRPMRKRVVNAILD